MKSNMIIRIIAVLILASSSVRLLACTSVIVSGKATRDGRPLIFKNRDTGMSDNVAVIMLGERYSYIGIVASQDLKPENVWGGHNEVGFGIMNTMAYNMNGTKGEDVDKNGTVIRRALEVCRTLQDFENLLDTLPKPLKVNSNFGVLDAQGGCAYYETGNKGFVKYDANDAMDAPDGYIVRTNFGMTGNRNIDNGDERFMAMSDFMAAAREKGPIDAEYLISYAPRYLIHGLTKINLFDMLPANQSDVHFFPFRDFIPRWSSSSAILVQGVRPDEEPCNTVSWINIGWPLASVTIPLLIYNEVSLPVIVGRGENGKSWLCDQALISKKSVFSRQKGNKEDYIDISKLINAEQTGIMQKIIPIEAEVMKRGRKAIGKMRRKHEAADILRDYYTWVDKYVMQEYPKVK